MECVETTMGSEDDTVMNTNFIYEKRGGIYCCAQTCSSCSKGTELSFHTFPKDEARCREWLRRIGRFDLLNRGAEQLYGNYKICSLHFEEDMFMNASSKRRRLVWNAMPTLNLSTDILENRTGSAESSTESIDYHPINNHSITVQPYFRNDPMLESECISLHKSETETELPTVVVGKVVNEDLVDDDEMEADSSPVPAFIELSLRELPVHAQNEGESKLPFDVLVNAAERLTKRKARSLPVHRPSKFRAKSKRNPEPLWHSPLDDSDYKQVNILKSLLNLNEKSKEGWTDSMKEISFTLFHQCPKEYEFLSNFFSLPPLQSLRDWVGSLFIGSGFQKEVFIGVQHRLSVFKDCDRICSLSITELPLTEELFYSSKSDHVGGLVDYGNFGLIRKAASSALVFVVRGIKKEWNQPIGYFLKDAINSRILRHLAFECLTKLNEIDIDVKLIIGSPSKVNRSLFSDLGVTDSCPYFKFDNKNVFCMYEPSSLKTLVRNTLKKNDIEFDRKVCKWKYIEEFLEFDSNMVGKLTSQIQGDGKVSPVKGVIAPECFRKSVAAGVFTLGALGQFEKEAQQTAEFIDKMHDLCMIFNCDSKGFFQSDQDRFTDETAYSLRELLDWVNLWKVNEVTESLLCQKGWSVTINCLLQMWDSLKVNCKFSYIFTSRLHQNSLKELKLDVFKDKGKKVAPNAKQFDKIYKTCLGRSLFKPVKNSKGINDLNSFFIKYKELMRLCRGMSRDNVYFYHHLEESEKVDLPQANTLGFIACHLIRKLRLVVSCKNCLNGLTQEIQVPCQAKNSTPHGQSNVNSGGSHKKASRMLVAPHKKFLKILPRLESSFVFAFKNMYHMPRVKVRIHQFMYQDVLKDFADLHLDCEEVKKIIIGLFINISMDQFISMLSISKGRIVIPEHF